MHSFVALLATVATVSAAYVEPYQSSVKAYPSQKDYMHTVVGYPTYQRRAVAYKPASYQTPSPYSSDPAEYPEPTPYHSKKPYDPAWEYSYSSSSSSMPAGSFIDNTGVADLDENLANLPKRGDYAKTYADPPSYSSPAPTPYPSEKPYDPKYEYSYSSSSSSMPAGSFIDNTGVADLDDNLANLPKRGEYPKEYHTTKHAEYSYSYSYSSSSSFPASSSSSSAPAGSAAAGGLPGLGGLLGDLPVRRHEPTNHPGSQVPHPTASAQAGAGGLGGLLGDLPLA